jgi:Flp pilus assembly pilin Flp
MLNLYCKLKARLASRDRGMTATEYALILFAVVAVIGTIVGLFGARIEQIFTDTCNTSLGGC